jgi:3-dehydroquinate dehydratase II
MRILLLNGPNLNRLGTRSATIYGATTLPEIVDAVRAHAARSGHEVLDFQSNHEGALIDWLQEQSPSAHGVLVNPGGLAHYSIALRDALEDTKLPVVEVHISDVMAREPFRQTLITATAAAATITGKGWQGYLEGVDTLIPLMSEGPNP